MNLIKTIGPFKSQVSASIPNNPIKTARKCSFNIQCPSTKTDIIQKKHQEPLPSPPAEMTIAQVRVFASVGHDEIGREVADPDILNEMKTENETNEEVECGQ